jgi:phytoene synthase
VTEIPPADGDVNPETAVLETTASADQIVARSGSNLAYALKVLPRAKRDDMRIFYGFCRIVDDIADDPGLSPELRRGGLDRWRALVNGAQNLQPPVRGGIETEFRGLCERYSIPAEVLLDIIAGVEMDIRDADSAQLRFADFEQLRGYCYRVASAVGLASIEIFGYSDPACREYAEQLGYAFQLTNILRDVGQDAGEGRLYLALDELARFGIEEAAILDGSAAGGDEFQRFMEFQAERAEDYYSKAVAALPDEDRKSMRAAELMRVIYSRILQQMKSDGFRVFEKRYKLSKLEMAAALLKG